MNTNKLIGSVTGELHKLKKDIVQLKLEREKFKTALADLTQVLTQKQQEIDRLNKIVEQTG